MNSVLRVKSDTNHTDQARLHFRNKLSKFSSSSLHKTHLVSVTMFHSHYPVSVAKYSSQNFQIKTLKLQRKLQAPQFSSMKGYNPTMRIHYLSFPYFQCMHQLVAYFDCILTMCYMRPYQCIRNSSHSDTAS